mmetsp:Transcript_49517/g.107256  ORF Transcript_49517/g.107256 Transcript_49517/m.107256 type:complete len:175 (+) Transcript_49517:266-790(+)
MSTPLSFIARAKMARSHNALIGPFASAGRFDYCLEQAEMQCVHAVPGSVLCKLQVREPLANNFGTLHGGAISTLVDVVGTIALLSKDMQRAGVSVEMNQTFCSAARIGEWVWVHGAVLKYGRRLGFTEVRIFSRGEDTFGEISVPAEALAPPQGSRLVAVGRHTKAFVEAESSG